MSQDTDQMPLFASSLPSPAAAEPADGAADGPPPWTVLIVDDEPEVHKVSWLVLEDMRFRGRSLRLLGAASAVEAQAILAAEPDVAVILLDVVMETEDAGLRLVRTVREDMGNAAVRIILRTGQPGQAPERRVVVDYDINDYKAKSELTADRLFASVISALRAYEDIRTIERFREQAFGVLGEQMGLMHDLLALCPAPLALLCPDGVVSACAPAFAERLCGTPDAVIGAPLPMPLGDAVAAALVAAAGHAEGMAVADGLRMRLCRDAGGRVCGAVLALEDA